MVTTNDNNQFSKALFLSSALFVFLSICFIALGAGSIIQGVLYFDDDDFFGKTPAAFIYGPGLSLLFMGFLGSTIGLATLSYHATAGTSKM